jgi:hypothetical protein
MKDKDDAVASVSRTIRAPAERLFAVLADPAKHPGIDGSGMLRESSDPAISGVGDEFTMKMYHANRGDNETTNHVVEYVLNRRIGWEPVISAVSRPEQEADIGTPMRHRWVFELTAAGQDSTVVTETYDCSRSPEWMREKGASRWVPAMSTTLEKLDECTVV